MVWFNLCMFRRLLKYELQAPALLHCVANSLKFATPILRPSSRRCLRIL